MRRNELGRAAVLMGGMTVGSIVALLIVAGRAGEKPQFPNRRQLARIGNSQARTRAENRGRSPEDVLERYRLAAAV